MKQYDSQWAPGFEQNWRESEDLYRRYKSERNRQLVLKSLALREGDHVLEIGCGYGSQAEMIHSLEADLPSVQRRTLLAGGGEGIEIPHMAGDGILATVPLSIGPLRSSPWKLFNLSVNWTNALQSDAGGWFSGRKGNHQQ